MATLTAKAGPGGTEFITRSNRLEQSNNRWDGRDLGQSEFSAYRLRRAVEQAQEGESAASPAAWDTLERARSQRLQFWVDTCREVTEMRSASAPVLDLHKQQGCRFFAPSFWQVQQILDALDSALPFWDRDHEELFYRTLELNFPDLLRHRRHHPGR
jgi:hypothetical protein